MVYGLGIFLFNVHKNGTELELRQIKQMIDTTGNNENSISVTFLRGSIIVTS